MGGAGENAAEGWGHFSPQCKSDPSEGEWESRLVEAS